MKKKTGNTKIKGLLVLALSLILGVICIYPQLQAKDLTPLDFEESLGVGRADSFKEAVGLSLVDYNRFRPVYRLERYLALTYLGYASQPYYLINGVVLGSIIFFVWKVLGNQSLLDFLTIFLVVVVTPATVDNFYRLGTAEPIYSLFLAVSLYLLLSTRLLLLSISILLLMLSKETAVFVVPIMVGYMFIKKRKRAGLAYLVMFLMYLGLIVQRLTRVGGDQYHAQFSIDLTRNIETLWDFGVNNWPILSLLMIETILAVILWRSKKADHNNHEVYLILLLGWSSVLPLMFKWEQYYAFPTVVLGVMGLVFALNKFNMTLFKKGIIYILIILIMGWGQYKETIRLAEHWHSVQIGDAALTGYLMKEGENKTRLKYYVTNKSLHNMIGSWMILSDFGKVDVDYFPSNEIIWSRYNENGVEGINELGDEGIKEYTANPRGSVLISNPCVGPDEFERNTYTLCGHSEFLDKPACFWCVTR